MRVISVNVGEPREIQWRGEAVLTGIFKQPVDGRVALRSLNLEGDGQADLTVHGGVDKAIYAYPSEHYAFWRDELPDAELGWGARRALSSRLPPSRAPLRRFAPSCASLPARGRVGRNRSPFTIVQPRL